MTSSRQSTPYHERIDMDIEPVPTIQNPSMKCLELSYEAEQEKESRVGIVANHQETSRPQNVNNEASPSHAHHEDDVINIQLPYDPQAPTVVATTYHKGQMILLTSKPQRRSIMW